MSAMTMIFESLKYMGKISTGQCAGRLKAAVGFAGSDFFDFLASDLWAAYAGMRGVDWCVKALCWNVDTPRTPWLVEVAQVWRTWGPGGSYPDLEMESEFTCSRIESKMHTGEENSSDRSSGTGLLAR